MKILIATGIYPPDVGGPAKYAENLANSLRKMGHEVFVLSYGIEKKMPWGLRQFYYFLRAIFKMARSDGVIALDTVSVGFPAVLAAFILGKRSIVRTGGDFLWESYLERSGIKIPLPDFYTILPKLSAKERIILKIHNFLIDYVDFLVFSTAWQRDIWAGFYSLNFDKVRIIENCYPPKRPSEVPVEKVFLAASRQIAMKNLDFLEEGFQLARKKNPDIKLDRGVYSPEEYEKKLKSCYALAVISLGDISPNSVIEAISFNKPFVITKYNGIKDRLGKAGVEVDPNDVESIGKGFEKMCDEKIYKSEIAKLEKINFSRDYNDIAGEFMAVFDEKVEVVEK